MYPVAVLIITYNRRDILRDTIASLAEHLRGEYHIFVADDGSDDGTQEMLHRDITLVQSSRVGLGANANAGLKAAFTHSDIVLQLQDDMALQKPLDLTPHVERLAADATSGFIRLWGVGGHRYTATLEGSYWRIDWRSDELYIPSDRPHIKHQRFHGAVGFYPEGLPTAETEDAWCHQCKDIALERGAPSVLVPLQWDTESGFEHMGWHSRWRDKGL